MSRLKGFKHSEATKRKQSLAASLRKDKQVAWNKGLTKETSPTIAKLAKDRIGEGNPMYGRRNYNWKGITPLTSLIRCSSRYINWRNEVYKRDNYTCQECGDNRGGNLEAHHRDKAFIQILNEFLKTYSQFSPYEEKEILYRISYSYNDFWKLEGNVTLCENCHIKEHKILEGING